MKNFDIKKFLVENKLTENSKLVKEGTKWIDSDELPDDVEWEVVEEWPISVYDADVSLEGYSEKTGLTYYAVASYDRQGEEIVSEPYDIEVEIPEDKSQKSEEIGDRSYAGAPESGLSTQSAEHIHALGNKLAKELHSTYGDNFEEAIGLLVNTLDSNLPGDAEPDAEDLPSSY